MGKENEKNPGGTKQNLSNFYDYILFDDIKKLNLKVFVIDKIMINGSIVNRN